MYFMDVHCHILPGVDDGSRNTEMSLEMLGIAQSQGIKKLILTPHYYLGKTKRTGADLKKIFEEFLPMASRQYPELALYLGNEIYYTEGVLEAVKSGDILTMADTKYVLVEFSPRVSYDELYGAIRSFVQGRYRPIIAHMERYQCLTKHIERVEELKENGAFMQMNADSLLGGMFDSETRWCRRLVQEGYISLLGTDAHNLDDRGPYVEETRAWLEKKLDAQELALLMYGNAEKMVNNDWLE